MNDTTTQIIGGGGALAAFVMFLRWAVTMWATVRREDIAATAATAAAVRADGARMVEALLAQARSNAELGGTISASNVELAGRIEKLTMKLDTLVEWRERTPVEGYEAPRLGDETPSERSRRRAAGSPSGYRTPKPGTHHDE